MGYASKLKRFSTIATGVFLAGFISIDLSRNHAGTQISLHLAPTSDALARSSGGRSGGGSFRSAPSRSSGSSSSGGSSGSGGSYSRRSSPSWNYRPYERPYYDRGPVILPIPAGPPVYSPSGPPAYSDPYRSSPRSLNQNSPSSQDDGSWIVGLIFLAVVGVFFLLIAYFVFRAIRGAGGGASGTSEQALENDTVTVSQVQVALLAQARYIQTELTKLSLEIDTSTSEGLLQLLQESALALLRSPENWSHVLASSETVRGVAEAEALFNKLSIAERSKFSVETLTNVGGRVNRKDFTPDPDEDPASYIVVTLLVGTAHDQPLFNQIRTTEQLKEVLEKLAAMPSQYLMVFELLWSPQEETDSLTYDELLTEYSNMVQI